MIFKRRRTYAVYIKFIETGGVACHIRYKADAGQAWLDMYEDIQKNGDLSKIRIVDVKRID